MITSVFSKSKPINIIIVISVIIIGFTLNTLFNSGLELVLSTNSVLCLILVVFYLFLADFIISKNELNKRNSYGILVFGLTTLIFPEIFKNQNTLITNLLILFATRRFLSLHTKKAINKKFFDAGFWIALASLFYTWAILFYVVLIFAFLVYWQQQIKQIYIVLFSTITVAILLVLYNVLFKDQFLPRSNFDFSYSFDFSFYNHLDKIIGLTIVITLYIWSSFFFLRTTNEKKKRFKPVYGLVFIMSIIALAVAIVSPEKGGSEYVFFMFPFSVVVGNYIQSIKGTWFKEVIVLLLLVGVLVNLVL